MADNNLRSSENFQKATMGQDGLEVLTSASSTTATGTLFSAIQVLSAAVITAVNNCPKGSNLSSQSVPAGTIIPGRFDQISLASGEVIVYYLS